jgi:hypothetical protein
MRWSPSTFLATLLVISAVAGITLSCNSSDTKTPISPSTRLLSLNDPANGYRDQYDAWDVWAFSNQVNEFTYSPNGKTAAEIASLSRPPADWVELDYMVDAQGCLIPYLVGLEEAQKANSTGSEMAPMPGHVKAEGVMVPEMKEQLDNQVGKIVASYQPRVPEWLAANPPEAAIFMPNGDILTRHRLGFAREIEEAEGQQRLSPPTNGDPNSYYRYDQEGNLKETVHHHWITVYVDESELPDDTEIQTFPGGLVAFLRDGEVVKSIEFDGSPVADNQTKSRYDPYFGVPIQGRTLVWLYEHQNNHKNHTH